MSRVEPDPERGRAAAARLKALGVKGILIKAAEQGYITQLACKMPECFCPEELGGACYFEPVTDELSDWMPTHEHFPRSKKEGGHREVDNAILAHRLCNRIDYSISVGRPCARSREGQESPRRSDSPHAPEDALTPNLGGWFLGDVAPDALHAGVPALATAQRQRQLGYEVAREAHTLRADLLLPAPRLLFGRHPVTGT